MPTYEYLCQKCQTTFTVSLSMSEHDLGQIECPHCASRDVTQRYSIFYAKTSKKS